jgi:hypothetical protein
MEGQNEIKWAWEGVSDPSGGDSLSLLPLSHLHSPMAQTTWIPSAMAWEVRVGLKPPLMAARRSM